METSTARKDGFWMMIEAPIDETKEKASAENNQPKPESEIFRDTYDFYPDSGF